MMETHLSELFEFVSRNPSPWVGLARAWVKVATDLLAFEEAHPDWCTRLRYEDLVTDPDAAISRVLGPLAESRRDDGNAGASSTAGYHTVSGNPMRLAKGPFKVAADVEWKSALPRRDRATVTALSLPLLLRYGYSPVLHS